LIGKLISIPNLCVTIEKMTQKTPIEKLGLPDPLADLIRDIHSKFSDGDGLPPRGTGLIEGTAGPRRRGEPRTEEERRERHEELYSD